MSTGIDWDNTAQNLGYPGAKEMWEDLYLVQKKSVSQLSHRFAVARNVVRQQLVKHAVTPRRRGGANNKKSLDLTALQLEVDTDGIKAVAARHHLDPTTLYKRLYYAQGRKKRVVRDPASLQAATVPQDDSESEDPDASR